MADNHKHEHRPSYNKTVCQFCPQRKECDALVSEWFCHQCPKTLVCALEDSLHLRYCDFARQKWKSLPRKCLLVVKLLEDHTREGECVLAPSELTSGGRTTCPRCVNTDAQWAHTMTWRAALACSKTISTYKFNCPFCGLDATKEVA